MDDKKPFKLPRTITRREFLAKSGLFAGGVVAVLSGSTALGLYGAGKKTKSRGTDDQQGSLVELGNLEDLEQEDNIVQVNFDTNIQDAWVNRKVNGSVYVTKDNEGKLMILSPVCTHLGCNVVFGSDTQKKTKPELSFYCPCHGGEYNDQGINIGGPPPRPLDIYEPFIQNGKVYINYFGQLKRS